MTSNSQKILRILSNLDTGKLKANQKECINELLIQFEDEEVRREITQNSVSKTQNGQINLTWHSLFIKCHEFILTVTKKAKVCKSDPLQSSFCILILDIVRHAITPSAVYLHPIDFIACIIQVLENENCINLHDTYLRLAALVVSNRHYRTSLSFDDWRKFFKIFTKMYDKPYISDQSNILENLQHVVHFGCLQCNLLLCIKKKILPFLLKVSDDLRRNSIHFGQQAYKLFYAVCQKMGYENRKALCEFSEKIMPRMLDDQLTEEKCKLMILFITLHHPNGVISSNPAACAFELSKWKMTMTNVYSYILKNLKNTAITPDFSALASEVFYLVMMDCNFYEEESNLSDNESSRRVKRRRLSIVKKPLDLFDIEYINGDIESQWYIVEILIVMVKKYPTCILNDNDFVSLMDRLSKLFAQAIKNEKIINSLCELCKILLTTENITSDNKKLIQETKKYWEKIWHTLLKVLCLEQNVIEGHKLLQLIITYVGIINVNEFICLYITNQIRWTPSSVYTFDIFSQNANIPEYIREIQSSSGDSVKLRVLQWVQKISPHTAVTPLTVTAVNNVLTNLVLKIWYKKNSKNSLNKSGISNNILSIDNEQKFINDITKCHMAVAFEIDLFMEQSSDLKLNSTKKLIKPPFSEEILTATVIKLCESISFTEDTLINIENAILNLAIVAKFTSNLLELNGDVTNRSSETLLDTLRQSLHSVYDFISTKNLLHRENNVINLIKAFITLYETPYNKIVAKLIVEKCPQKILIGFFDIINFENTNEPEGLDQLGIKYYEHIFNLQEYVKISQKYCRPLNYTIKVFDNDVITIAAHHALRSFMCMNTNDSISEIQKKILANLLKVEIYAPTVTGNLWQSLVFLKRIIQCRKDFYTDELIIDLTKFVNKLFHNWEHDVDAVISIFKLLPFIYEYTLHVDQSEQFINEIILYTHNQLNNKFGLEVSFSFLSCLNKIVKLIPQKQLSLTDPNQQTKCVAEILLVYLQSPFYIVRLEAVKIIYHIFSSSAIDLIIKKNLFKAINSIQFNIFMIDSDITGIWKEDEFINRTTTALYTFGSILHGSGLYQLQVLNSILRLYGEVDVPIDSINKILQTVIKNDHDRTKLIEMNLYYLLRKWIQEKYSTKPFPWELTQSESEVDFYKRYMGTIILLKLEEHNLSAVETLCQSIEYSFVKAIENSFPSLMTWLLVSLNLDSDNDHFEYATEILTRLRNNNNEFENVNEFSELFEEKSYDLLIDLVSRLHDENNFRQMFKVDTDRFPRYNLPCLSLQVLEKCFQYLETNFPIFSNSLIYFLASKRPSILQKILLTLSSNIFEFNMIEYQLKAFHQYTYFCNYLVKKISSAFFGEIVVFFLRDVCYTLLNLIKEEIDPLSELSAKFLYLFLQNILPSRSKEMSKVLNFVVTNLTSAIQQSDKISETGLQILRFLTVDSNEILSEAISKLDEFPSHPTFDELRINNTVNNSTDRTLNLRNRIEKFLESKYEQTTAQSSRGLQILKDELAQNKNELLEMYKELEKLRGFAEDCTSSIIHRLIYKLIKLTENQNINIALDAAKCLGELGPADLTTMILHPEDDQKRESGDPAEVLTFQIIIRLVEYIIDRNVNLRKSSADALYVICASPWSCKILNKSYLGNLEEPMLLAYIQPFLTKANNKSNTDVLLNIENCKKIINPQNNLWKSEEINFYKKWLINITCKILSCFNNFYSTILVPVCQLSTELCETILPRLLYLIIDTNSNFADDIYSCINCFFEEYFNSSNQSEDTAVPNSNYSVKKVESFSHQSVRCMLNVVNFIRIQLDNNFLLKLNYLHIAKAAQYCSAYFTSVLYSELYCETIKKTITERDDNISTIDYICEVNSNDGKSLQNILRHAFVEIGDPDSIHGCGLSHLKNASSRTQHYINLQQWDKVMITQDAELSIGYKSSSGMANALRHSGFDYLLNKFIRTSKNADSVNEYEYETAWRLADWNFSSSEQHFIIEGDDFLKSFADKNDNYYHNYHYQALKCLHSNDNVVLKNYIDVARMSIVKSLRNTSLECSQTVYPKLVQLQMLLELEELSISTPDDWNKLNDNWYTKYLPNLNDFMYVEPILAQRITMCKIKYLSSNNKYIKDALIKTYLELSEVAEIQGYPQIATRLLIMLSNENNLSEEIKNQLQFRDALLSWERNDRDIARYLMRDLLNKNPLTLSLKAQALRVYGNWMAETKSENPQAVIDNYYEESIKISMKIDNKSFDDINNLNNTHAALAQFADAQYQQINTFMKTPQFESLKECAKYAQRTNNLKTNSKDTDVNRALSTLKKQNSIDVAEYVNIQNERKMYLELTAKYYLKTLEASENHNFFIFRLISLWLKNKDDNELYQLFNEHLKKIPSFKFIPLVPQLAPHLSNKISNQFTKTINDLLRRCANDHPHHTLPTLLALMNTQQDYNYYKPGSNVINEPNDRELGAKQLISELSKSNKLAPIIFEMKNLALALIMLAYFKFEGQKSSNSIPRGQKILTVKNYQHCLVPTITLDVESSGQYNEITSIYKYEESFRGVGGVNAPKQINCIGTDGIRRKQLIKGKDDLRQDAVMQQVFTVMNMLLKTSKESKRRKLNVRTYKVIPLSQRSGILEWCDNTEPIFSILSGSSNPKVLGMHEKYHPNDWKIIDIRNEIKNAASSRNNVKLQTYLKCCKHLQPAFQYFFMEKFPSPETWFERRLAYVRSVATNSMVGYILGLGDRHVSNILLDTKTAEVIHIDFGIAFEQGKVLPVPETVPFRLTRDMEAAMGVSGVEGVMRKSSEETMSVLRNRRDIIITLLQVLLYDPLFSWAITPAKAWELQSDSPGHVREESHFGAGKLNKIAERALLRIEQKLIGTEEGLATSISGQVERLIQEARDPANLSRLFCGWQAYL